MVEPSGAVAEPTLVNTPEPAPAPGKETIIYPTPEQKAAADAAAKTKADADAKAASDKAEADKAAAAKAEADKAAAEKAKADAEAAEKAKREGKPPPEPTKKEPAKGPDGAQTDYELALPKDSLLTAEDLAAIAKEAKEAGLSKEEAEEVVKAQSQVASTTAARVQAQQQQAFEAEKAAWKKAVADDAEMGGDKLAETTLMASRAFQALASPLLKKLADDTGLGSHPEFVRMMAKIGKMMGEDRLIIGHVGGAPEEDTSTADGKARKMYGKTTPDGSGRKAA